MPVADRTTTVMLIDDSLTFRSELRFALEAAGYSVAEAGSGEEGLRLAAGQRPGAVIVDGVLPGIDGATVIRRIRLDAALRGVPCLLLTGSEGKGAELRALDAGADAFVRKEEDTSVVLARLGAVLRQAAAGQPASNTVSLLGPRKVLAVDDSATYLQALGDALRGEGYDVILARSGEEALELLAVQSVDCILLDLVMPGAGRPGDLPAGEGDAPSARHPARHADGARRPAIDGCRVGGGAPTTSSRSPATSKSCAHASGLKSVASNSRTRPAASERICWPRSSRPRRRARAARSRRRAPVLVDELERKNKELEAFSYSVSHDLRTPLRGIDGFSQILLDDYSDRLDDQGRDYLNRVRRGAQRMGALIEDMLHLFRVANAELVSQPIDLTQMARVVAAELARNAPDREISVLVQEGLTTTGDPNLLRIALDNLIGNAWKFASKVPLPQIEIGVNDELPGHPFFVRDNGAGFDMTYAGKLFRPFQRLHTVEEFPGTGIGLATVHKVIERSGGRVWAEGQVGKGSDLLLHLAASQARPSDGLTGWEHGLGRESGFTAPRAMPAHSARRAFSDRRRRRTGNRPWRCNRSRRAACLLARRRST